MRYAVALCLLLCAPLFAGAKVTSIFKPQVEGEITRLDDVNRLEIKIAGSDVPERIGLDEVEEVSFGQTAVERKLEETPLRVLLNNGDLLYGAPLDGPEDNEDLFKLTSPRLGELTIDINSISRIENVATVKPGVLPDIDPKDNDIKDYLYFAPDGGDPKAELVRVTKSGMTVYNEILKQDDKFAWSRIKGIVRKPKVATPEKALFGIFTFRDGSVLSAKIKTWGAGKIELEHSLGKVTIEERNLMSVTMKNGRYVYLSDLEFASTPDERPYYLPADFKYENYLFKVRKDRAQGGGAMTMRGRTFAKGLGVHALSKLKYSLRKGYSKLVATLGVDDSAGDLASVEFKIYADGKLIYESGVVRRSTKPIDVSLDVLNVGELTLEVTAADNADIQDRANWGNIKVVR
jgi:hypothetical protein